MKTDPAEDRIHTAAGNMKMRIRSFISFIELRKATENQVQPRYLKSLPPEIKQVNNMFMN
ncbi:MAG: hypothetical protein K9J12_04385 [Melioribacteraceae bacterium]|nr:hypothetical protein [Melioribacteraceae bacterium]MCF8265110.1 hypothetical protein [Melioribacteraceae bacterium]MCF8413229.1 hypothetical protein [Melioribacteraceae bacterium]